MPSDDRPVGEATARTMCGSLTEIPTAIPSEPGVVQRLGYPDNALAACCLTAEHDGKHFACLPLASGPGSFSMSWEPS